MKNTRSEFEHPYNNVEVQKHLLACLISDPDAFATCRTIANPDYFDVQITNAARFIFDHTDQYGNIPSPDLIRAKTGLHLTPMDHDEMVRSREWLFTEFEGFCKYRALENLILDGVNLLRDGKPEEIVRRARDALTMSLLSDLGTSYFDVDPKQRLATMLDKTNIVSTGWKTLDAKLYGGFTRGALNVFCGYSGSGKSILLQNLALNWAKAGATVVYFTLELAEDMSSFRLDSMLTGLSTQEIVQDLDKSSLMIGMQGKGAGKLFVKKMPEGSTTTNNLRGFLKELQIKTGLKPDAILVDYLDLMYPNNQRVDPSDLFVKDKFVSEELRALMHETGTYGATASQLNRGAIQAQGEFDHSHIAGGISKINTADNVFYIYAPDHYKERGEYEIHFLKTRSSASTGQKIKLHYDRKCMRLSDPGEEFAFAADKPATREDLKAELNSKIQSKVAPAPTNALSELMSRTRRNT